MENQKSPIEKNDRKRKMRNLFFLLFMLFIILIACSVILTLYGDNLFTPKESETKYIYKSTPRVVKPINTRREGSIEQSKSSGDSRDLSLNSEKHTETEGAATPSNSEMSTPGPNSIPDVNTETPDSTSEQDRSMNKQKEEERRQAWEKRKAEINETIEMGEEALKDASKMLDQLIPQLANHLNTLSPEEQHAFLKQMETMMYRQMPPESQDLFKEHPEHIDEGWKLILDQLAEHGYTPPRGF